MDRLRLFPLPIRHHQADGSCDYVNEAWLKFTGGEHGDQLGNGWLSSIHPEDLRICRDNNARPESSSETAGEPYRVRSRDGEYRWLNEFRSRTGMDDGLPAGYLAVCYDIRQGVAQQAKLEGEAAALQLVAESSDQLLWLRDAESKKMFYISPAYERIWGRSRESLQADPLSWREAIHPDDKEWVVTALTEDPLSPKTLTYRILRPAGDLRWVTTRITPVQQDDGKVKQIAGIVTDVTEQRQTEEALQESESRLRQVAENTDFCFWLQERIGPKLLYVSRGYEKITGRSLDSIYASPRSWRELIHPEDYERVMRVVTQPPAPGDPPFRFRIVRADGQVRWILQRAFPIFDDHGQVIRIVGVAEDVTAQVEMEQALRDSEQRFLQLAQNIESVFWIWTREAVLFVSDAYRKIWGRDPAELYQSTEPWRKALHPDDREMVLRATTEGAPTTPADIQYRILRPNGEVRWVRDRVFPIRDNTGEVIRWAALTDDITESKKADDALAAANNELRILSRRRVQVQEEERKSLALELHDQIGQSLTALKIAVESAKRGAVKPPVIRHLTHATELIDGIVDDVRRLSMELRPPSLDPLGLVPTLRSLLSECGDRSEWNIQFHDASLRRPDAEVEIACFRICKAALANVMRHARAKNVDVRIEAGAEDFCVTICDDGVGFDMAEAARRIARDHLGLVGMNERAMAVGGRFECKSSPNEGTRISVVLPYHSA